MDEKQTELRDRYGRQHLPRLFPSEGAGDKQHEVRDRSVGIGVALGAAFGMALGAGLGVVLGNLAWGIGIGLSVGTGVGIAIGVALGNKPFRTYAADQDRTS